LKNWRSGPLSATEGLGRRKAFTAHLAPLQKKKWFVYAKPPFAGPGAVLAYLARYTHRVAIANSRLVSLDERGVSFRYKDYRRNGQARFRTMTLEPNEFTGASCCMFFPSGSIASVTTDCSPAPPARPISHAPGS
jgi:hypothetical protein